MKTVFASAEKFKDIFNNGLAGLAQDTGLGTFILAMANASFDQDIYSKSKLHLQNNFQSLAEKYSVAFRQGKAVDAVDEDLLVFLKMICVGFDNLQMTESRNDNGWELQYNHIRGFRPARISKQKIDHVFADFSPKEFNFNKPFLAKERLWEGEYEGNTLSLFYNKYPFAPFHLLLVPERENNYPQYLESKHHALAWDFLQSVGLNIRGAGLGYNSRGAFASVNHLHFQFFIRPNGLPVTSAEWVHNGGSRKYPVECKVFTNVADSWEYINQLQQNNIACNLVYTPGHVYCLPRKMQGSYTHAKWTTGFSWYEMAGGILTANRDSYLALGQADIENEFSLLGLNSG